MSYKREKNYWQQDIRRYEYVLAMIVGMSGILIISYLFYGTIFGAILISPYMFLYIKSWKKQVMEKKKRNFRLQFREALHLIGNALNVGYSVENAMRESLRELETLYRADSLIMREFAYMIRQIELNVPMEKVWKDFADRTREEDVQTFSTVFRMAKRSGGDMIAIIKNTVQQMAEKSDVEREIETVITAKKLEFRVMSAIPFGMICYMRISFPEFMSVLYGNFFGICIMTVCLAVYMCAYEVGRRMIEIEV